MVADPDSRVKDVLDDILALVGGGSGSVMPPMSVEAFNELTDGVSTMGRALAVSNSRDTISQRLNLTYFTSVKSFTSSQVRTYSGSVAAAATPTVCRIGLYLIAANGDGTLVASTANDTALWATQNTLYTKAWSTPYALVSRQRYALAFLVVTAGATPTWVGALLASGAATAGPIATFAPRMTGLIAGQSDLPASFLAATPADMGNRFYGAIIT